MKQFFFVVLFIMQTMVSNSQSYRTTMGQEIKLRKGTSDLDIVTADNTGLYFTEKKLKVNGYFILFVTTGEENTLYKFDKNFNPIYDRSYKKELKGLSFHSFQALDNEIFLFATDYLKKEKLFKAYGVKVDKTTGNLQGDFIELGSFQLESKKDDFEMKLTKIKGGKNFLMVCNISSKDKASIGISILDKGLQKKESGIINLDFEPQQYSLQDVHYTNTNKLLLLGREYEQTEVGKKKKKQWIFKQYTSALYAVDGAKEKDILLNSNDRFIINGKLIDRPDGGVLLAGFYSNTAKKEGLNGFYINKIDVVKGALELTAYKEINSAMLGQSYSDANDEDEEQKENKKKPAKKGKDDDDDEVEFPNDFAIRSVDINPLDSSIIITSEVFQFKHYYFTQSDYVNGSWRYTTTQGYRFTNKDILIINASKNGEIKWLNALPKNQVEDIRSSSTSTGGLSVTTNWTGYFATAGGMPYYSSFSSLIAKDKLILLFNDHTSNTMNTPYGEKVKEVNNFKKRSNVYAVAIDFATGEMKRKFILANDPETVLMPRHAYVFNTDFIMPSLRMKALGKSELKFVRINVK